MIPPPLPFLPGVQKIPPQPFSSRHRLPKGSAPRRKERPLCSSPALGNGSAAGTAGPKRRSEPGVICFASRLSACSLPSREASGEPALALLRLAPVPGLVVGAPGGPSGLLSRAQPQPHLNTGDLRCLIPPRCLGGGSDRSRQRAQEQSGAEPAGGVATPISLSPSWPSSQSRSAAQPHPESRRAPLPQPPRPLQGMLSAQQPRSTRSGSPRPPESCPDGSAAAGGSDPGHLAPALAGRPLLDASRGCWLERGEAQRWAPAAA